MASRLLWGMVGVCLAITAGFAGPAYAGRYVLVESSEAALCAQVLAQLNDRPELARPYTWDHRPRWTPPIVPLRWDRAPAVDEPALLRETSRASCQAPSCGSPAGFWDTPAGRKQARGILGNDERRFDSARATLDGDQPGTFIRVHELWDETGPIAGEDAWRFNSDFFRVVRTAPLTLEALRPQHHWADVARIGDRPFFYGFDSRDADDAGRRLDPPQSTIQVGAPGGDGDACEMAYRLGRHEAPRKAPLDPSFDCLAAAGATERFICANLALEVGALDLTMAGAYRAALGRGRNDALLAAGQRRWLASRDRLCPIPSGARVPYWRARLTALCLRDLYVVRIADLRAAAGPDDPFAHQRVWREGAAGRNTDDSALLANASQAGDLLTVERLLSSGARLDPTEALYGAAISGAPTIVRRLIAAGAAPNAVPPDAPQGRSALLVALDLDNRAAAEVLLEHGGSIRAVRTEVPLLSYAVMTGKVALVRKVLATHPDVDAPGPVSSSTPAPGDTALIIAIERGRREIVRVLLEAGADPNAPGREGSPLALARSLSGDPAIVSLLRLHGAR